MSARASYQQRKCLRCCGLFASEWIGNRICGKCAGAAKKSDRREKNNSSPRTFDRTAAMERLLGWMRDHHGDLPPLAIIATTLSVPTAMDAWSLLVRLQRNGVIAWRSGTRSEARGHQAIRVVATGKILKTRGCPFEPPGAPAVALTIAHGTRNPDAVGAPGPSKETM